jgi:hypothetical protein
MRKIFSRNPSPQKIHFISEVDLMQSHTFKVMVPEQLGPQSRKVILYVLIWEILANMTQVSDVAHGPLVCM